MIIKSIVRERAWTVRAPDQRRAFVHVVARDNVLHIKPIRAPRPQAAWRLDKASGALRRAWSLEDEPPARRWFQRRKAA